MPAPVCVFYRKTSSVYRTIYIAVFGKDHLTLLSYIFVMLFCIKLLNLCAVRNIDGSYMPFIRDKHFGSSKTTTDIN